MCLGASECCPGIGCTKYPPLSTIINPSAWPAMAWADRNCYCVISILTICLSSVSERESASKSVRSSSNTVTGTALQAARPSPSARQPAMVIDPHIFDVTFSPYLVLLSWLSSFRRFCYKRLLSSLCPITAIKTAVGQSVVEYTKQTCSKCVVSFPEFKELKGS